MSKLTPKFTYANVAATLALVFSMSGGALAASHYLINSKKQINPKVLKALEGAKGPKGVTGGGGPTGPTGSVGATGGTGPEGKPGHDGTKGGSGPQGEPGGTGPTGPSGPSGPQGTTGPKGEAGENGGEGKPGAEGKQGPTGGQGATGEKGAAGGTGPTGENGYAVAYAHVSKDGVLSASKNVGKVERLKGAEEEGVFCLSGITGSLHNVVATIDYDEAVQLSVIRATIGTGDEVCPSGTDVTVETSAAVFESGELDEKIEPQGFYVTVN